MRTLILIPTYNEVENIGVLLDQLLKILPGIDILIIDDNSRDGTIEEIRNYQLNNPNIHLVVRLNEKGLGTALRRGYKKAYEDDYDAVVQMDADLQHPPEIIPELIKIIEEGYDVAVASRYVNGGRAENWPLYRRLISSIANLYARFVLGLKTKDVTTGFRAFSRKALKYLVNMRLRSKGFMIQVETLYLLERGGFKIREYPFIFRNRNAGKSKLKFRVIIEFFFSVLLLRLRRY